MAGSIRSQAVAKADQAEAGGTVTELVRSLEPELRNALPPGTLDPARFVRLAVTALRLDAKKGGKLGKCDPASLLGALMQSAQLGLEPHGPLGQAYFVPYGREITFIIGWKGYVALADRAGITIETAAVYEHDAFIYERGLEPKLQHVPTLGEPGKPVAYYAIARRQSDGSVWTHVMTPTQVERIKKRSKAATSGPWVTDYEAMALKTVVRQLQKVLPLSTDAMAVADSVDGSTVVYDIASRETDIVVNDDEISELEAKLEESIDAATAPAEGEKLDLEGGEG